MNNKDIKEISTKNEIKKKGSSSDDQIDSPSTSYYINQFQKILLDIDEKPDIIIEKILISIFNRYISPEINENENFDIFLCQKKINILSLKHKKYQIIYFLLTKIRCLIKKYREKIFELPNIIELKEKFFQKFYIRSTSYNKRISKNYINLKIDRPVIFQKSIPKRKKIFDYFATVKNLFYELKNIKNCLEKTAPLIEKIFENPLSEFDKFSIYECEKEDYLKILIHDKFIWNEIIKNRNTKLSDLIQEITKDEHMNLTLMTNKIEYFKKLKEYRSINIDELLKIKKVGSSIDSRFPEDARPIAEIKYRIKEYYDNITAEISNINYFPSNEEIDIDEYSNIEEQEQSILSNDIINSLDDATIYNQIKETIITQNNSKSIKKSIIKNNPINKITNINTINIKEDNTYIDIPNLLKNNSDIINKRENFEKKIAFENIPKIQSEISTIINKNINNINFEKDKQKILKNKEKILKNKKETKKENNNENNKFIKGNKKLDKKEIPSDIDDLVKYIENDDKTETQNKKKKKNKKKNKKNKNEIKVEKEEDLNEEDKKENEENNKIKNNITDNSINRFKIHKIKFKYRPEWLDKISNYP